MLDSASDVPVQKKVSVVMKKDLIFNEIEDLVPPTLLSKQSGSFKFPIKLSADQAEKLGMGRDVARKPIHHQFKVVLRICRFWGITFDLDYYIGISAITINNSQLIKFQNIDQRPLDITSFLKISPLAENLVFLDRKSASHSMVIAVYFVSDPTAAAIVRKVIRNPSQFLASDWTRNKLSTVHPEEGVLSSEFSLVCPLTQKRFEIPVRGKNCQHLACFDAHSFINLGLTTQKREWFCPICNAHVLPGDLVVDGFCLEVLGKLKSDGDDSTKIRMNPNGEWSPVRANFSTNVVDIEESSCLAK
ncbi:E3 SUMO-protein ligase [Nesidiocoris tenuis]|uniref:E3 SUMO-protein ligase n=1 Tax=Nesidiocoris tenuis TaxID=355587 RepID=A0ABN7B2N1_9HEMI|nr:E3 SUMO-protein ligase [Nesidiocoris tenuis]